jgi:hypothetical protein
MKLIIQVILIFLIQSLYGQIKTKAELQDSIDHQCTHRNKFTVTERHSNYPFNSTKEVRIVSITKSLGYQFLETNKVDLSLIKESAKLDSLQIDSLTDILYNIDYKGTLFYYSEGCFFPKNAILFFDTDGQVFAFIELSFQCSGFKVSSKKVTHLKFCNEKYDLLKSFFRKSGVLYGTD